MKRQSLSSSSVAYKISRYARSDKILDPTLKDLDNDIKVI
jgi:hypothetical protein